MNKIILVHGINNEGKSEQQIIWEWIGALGKKLTPAQFEKLMEKEIFAPYYGDVLEGMSNENSQDAIKAVAQGDVQSVNEETEFYSNFFKQSLNISNNEIEVELADQSPVVAQAAYHNRNVIAVMRVAERLFPKKVEKLLKILPQAYTYLKNPNASAVVDSIVKPHVKDHSALIVSHSLGTIVTYKALRECPSPNLFKFMTLGSPLGIEAVKESVRPPFVKPDAASIWLNGSDKDDFVGAGKKLSSCGYEHLTDENFGIDNGKDNPHSISKYLNSSWVVNNIISNLGLG